MLDLTPYLSFAVVSLVMAISPGPGWAYTISTTLRQGRSAGMLGNLGNSAGILCHALAATLGLSAIISYSVTAFQILKIIGAIYLVYLGILAFRGKGLFAVPADRPHQTGWQTFRGAALVNILNPKMVLLFVALLPQFVSASSLHPQRQIAAMGIMHAVIAFLVHTNVVLLSSTISTRLEASARVQSLLRYAMGSLFICFGICLGLYQRA